MTFPQTHVDGEVWNGAAVTDLETRASTFMGTAVWGTAQMPTSVAIVSAANAFTQKQTVTHDGEACLILANTNSAEANHAPLGINPQGCGLDIVTQTDWAAQTTGQTTYDSIGITHRTAGDGIFISNHGGRTVATLATGTVAANTGIVWVANTALTGVQQNAVTVAYVVAGLNTPLSVAVVGSAITVNLATGPGGAATSTAADVIAAARASATVLAKALAFPLTTNDGSGNPSTSTGAGVLSAMGTTSLAGGFTGSAPGGQCAFNSYVPMFNDDGASGQGTSLVYKAGGKNLVVQHGNPYSQANAMQIDYRSNYAAINIVNQSTGALNAAPASPADGTGMAVSINDYSTVDTIAIDKQAAPAVLTYSGQGTVASNGAIISLYCNTGTTTYAAVFCKRAGDTKGFQINNDGTALFGALGNPAAGMIEIRKDSGGASNSRLLYLSNPNTTGGAGAQLEFQVGGNQTGLIQSVANTVNNAPLSISTRYNGAMQQMWSMLQYNGYYVPLKNLTAGNEATGAKSAALGANCPATTETAPYTWEKIVSSDGSVCYFPVWK